MYWVVMQHGGAFAHQSSITSHHAEAAARVNRLVGSSRKITGGRNDQRRGRSMSKPARMPPEYVCDAPGCVDRSNVRAARRLAARRGRAEW